MKKVNLFNLMSMLLVMAAISLVSCTKEGPAGPAGANGTNGNDGTNGTNGTDGTAGCIECHNPDQVDLIAVQYDFSKHKYGEAAFEEAGNTGCTPCHGSEAFKYVVENNIPSTFSPDPANAGKFKNDYATVSTAAYGEIGCSTCHSALHTTYAPGDLALTTIAPVSMTMWGGVADKVIDLPADGGRSNLCAKCHQPRPFTNSAGDRNVLDYAALVADPPGIFFDPAVATTKLKPGYRTHTHYGTAGAVFAGLGGIEFTGSYPSSVHTENASCQDCHMATISGRAGGHTFFAKGNFNGCNVADCHDGKIDPVTDPDNYAAYWTTPRADVKTNLDALAAALNYNGIDILNRNPDTEANLWAANTTNKYDGYLNIYDPINNPEGEANNPTGIFQNPAPPSTTSATHWTEEQYAHNLTLPIIILTNAQMGSIINFQLCLRDFSLGIHNYKYTMALLDNSLAVLD